MTKKVPRRVLVDTSFLIYVNDSTSEYHDAAKSYKKYFSNNNIHMYLSTIAIFEYHQKHSILETVRSGDYITMPFNIEEAVDAADIAYNLGGTTRGDESKPKYLNDIKLMGQARKQNFEFIITGDKSTLARYCQKLKDGGMFEPTVITLDDGFDESYFNDGQTSLI